MRRHRRHLALIRRECRNRIRLAAKISRQIAEALEHAHQFGVLHRDIKPSNILIDGVGQAYLTDFGLAHMRNTQLTMSGDVLGTLRYMSPEQALGRRAEIGERSDIYSLGATLHEMVTLTPLFSADDTEALFSAIVHREAPRPRQLDHRIPRDLETIILKATARESSDRYESAAAVAEDLQRFLDDHPIHARRLSLVDRIGKWSRRHMKLVATATIVLLALVVLLSLSVALITQAQQRTQDSLGYVEDMLYARDVTLAYNAWEKRWSDQASTLLNRHVPGSGQVDRRGIEWYLLHSIVKEPPPLTLRGHEGAVNEVAVFPDRKRLATAGDDGIVQIWSLADGRLLSTIDTHQEQLSAVAISPCGNYVAAGCNTVSLWDPVSGAKIRDLTSHETTVEAIAFSPDGALIATGARYEDVQVSSVEGELKLQVDNPSRIESLSFFRDSHRLLMPYRTIASGLTHEFMRSLDLRTGKGDTFSPFADVTLGVVGASGTYAAIGGRDNTRIFLTDLDTGRKHLELPRHRDELNMLAISPTGGTVAAVYRDGVVTYWRITQWEVGPSRSIKAHDGSATYVQLIDDQRLVTCGADGTTKIWDMEPSERVLSLGPTAHHTVTDMAFAADGQHLAVVHKDGLLWHGESGGGDGVTWRDSEQNRLSFDDVAYSPRGDLLAICSGESNRITLWDIETQQTKQSFFHEEGSVRDICFSPDGCSLASTGDDGEVHIWHVDEGLEKDRWSLPHHGWALAYSRAGEVSCQRRTLQ